MKTSLTLLFLLLTFVVPAQISYTRADYGKNGDKVLYAVDTPTTGSFNFGATGPNYTWRFNTRKTYPRRYDSAQFIGVSINPNAPTVTTNLLIRGALTDQYQEVTDSFVKTIYDYPQYRLNGSKALAMYFPNGVPIIQRLIQQLLPHEVFLLISGWIPFKVLIPSNLTLASDLKATAMDGES